MQNKIHSLGVIEKKIIFIKKSYNELECERLRQITTLISIVS